MKVRTTFRPAPTRGRRANGSAPTGPAGPSRLARQLALAHHVERLMDAGELADYAEAARELRLSRARLTQIVNLTLAPEIQEAVLTGRMARAARRLRCQRFAGAHASTCA